ncbi:MAG: ribonuclease HII [Sphingobacteriales bacterium]|nr:ribonuclease HII [Sphingobacteriales bacterium]OJY92628.1 MAG: ribonuclease HII [Sphingobacteriales bacterium 44-15]
MLKAFYQDMLVEAGCDEAGRGCFAGPVFAAAVILPGDFAHPLLNDSKMMTAAAREEMRLYIEDHAIAFSVALVEVEEIDTINILNASFKAMHLALDGLAVVPELLLIDGNRFNKYRDLRHQCIIKGDGIYASIAAASVLAKTYRDAYMLHLHEQYPHYGWNSNKGYGTPAHRQAIMDYGLCEHHRKSFQCIPAQMDLFE